MRGLLWLSMMLASPVVVMAEAAEEEGAKTEATGDENITAAMAEEEPLPLPTSEENVNHIQIHSVNADHRSGNEEDHEEVETLPSSSSSLDVDIREASKEGEDALRPAVLSLEEDGDQGDKLDDDVGANDNGDDDEDAIEEEAPVSETASVNEADDAEHIQAPDNDSEDASGPSNEILNEREIVEEEEDCKDHSFQDERLRDDGGQEEETGGDAESTGAITYDSKSTGENAGSIDTDVTNATASDEDEEESETIPSQESEPLADSTKNASNTNDVESSLELLEENSRNENQFDGDGLNENVSSSTIEHEKETRREDGVNATAELEPEHTSEEDQNNSEADPISNDDVEEELSTDTQGDTTKDSDTEDNDYPKPYCGVWGKYQWGRPRADLQVLFQLFQDLFLGTGETQEDLLKLFDPDNRPSSYGSDLKAPADLMKTPKTTMESTPLDDDEDDIAGAGGTGTASTVGAAAAAAAGAGAGSGGTSAGATVGAAATAAEVRSNKREEPVETLVSAQSEFVAGLDDIDKFFEDVDPPDELDIGAGGTSIQEVLMGQGSQIIRKRIVMGFNKGRQIARDFAVQTSQTIWESIQARISEFRMPDKDDVVEAAEWTWTTVTDLFEKATKAIHRLIDGDFDVYDTDEDSEFRFEPVSFDSKPPQQQQQDDPDTEIRRLIEKAKKAT